MSIVKNCCGICCLIFIFLSSNSGFAQEKTTVLRGKTKSLKNDVSNILIVNLNSHKSTITDSLGLFVIEVELGDSLRISAIQYLKKEITITDKILNENLVVIDLVENIIGLDEVTVTPYNLTGRIDLDIEKLNIAPSVTASTLNLPHTEIEKMTQSERLLIEADRGKYIYYYGTAIVINTHKIMNKVSGRTKSFEAMVTRDKNMELEKEIIAKFSKQTIAENFNIPDMNVDGFLTFCMSQKDFSELSQAGNTDEIWQYLKTKSMEFNNTDFLKE